MIAIKHEGAHQTPLFTRKLVVMPQSVYKKIIDFICSKQARHIRFYHVHVGMALQALCVIVGLFWLRPSAELLALTIAFYLARTFFMSAANHRYFSHHSFKTSRAFQFILGIGSCFAMQRGPLWWASQHRDHHRYSDTENDPHPSIHGYWYAHCGWLFDRKNNATKWDLIRDFAKFPELRFLNHFYFLIGSIPGIFIFNAYGVTGLVWAMGVGAFLSHHVTLCVNSCGHKFGSAPFKTGDESRNNWLFAIIALGEGWHNNHHHDPRSARVGFEWWQIDPTYAVLKLFEWTGIIWDVKIHKKTHRAYQSPIRIEEPLAAQT